MSSSTPSPVRLGIHDASRAEWSVLVPVPLAQPLHYAIEVELRIPSQAFVQHVAWDHLQTFTRFDGGSVDELRGCTVTIDALRRTVLAQLERLGRESEVHARSCRLAASLVVPGTVSAPVDLTASIAAAASWIAKARAEVSQPEAGEAPELRRERALADEFLSVRLLEFLVGIERSLAAAAATRAPHAEELAPKIAEAGKASAQLLEAELLHRRAAGYVYADPESVAAQERYLERASQLKKHFQEVLFLEAERVQTADRIQHWAASLAAIVAAACAFVLQLMVTARAAEAERIGSSLIFLTLIAGISYAFRDRFKDIGRAWISGRVRRMYGERTSRFRAPARRLPSRAVVATARETFREKRESTLDPLNPASGACRSNTVLQYLHRGVVSPQPQLVASGVERIKHVFRYDLSPMFSRLDDAVKEIPVLDPVTRRVRFVEAPRCYRVPMKVDVTLGDRHFTELVTLVLHKRGLDRIEAGVEDSAERESFEGSPLLVD